MHEKPRADKPKIRSPRDPPRRKPKKSSQKSNFLALAALPLSLSHGFRLKSRGMLQKRLISCVWPAALPAWLCLMLSGCVFSPSGGLGGALLLPAMGSETSPPDSTYFYIDLDADHYSSLGVEPPLYEISTTEEYGDAATRDSVSNCEIEYIELDDISEHSEHKICILDIMEQELFLNPLAIKYNVPAGMCANIYYSVPWHYNFETGQGPLSVTECKRTTGSGDNQEEETYYCALGGKAQGVNPLAFDAPTSNFTCNTNLAAEANRICGLLGRSNGCLGTGLRCNEEEENLCAFNQRGADDERISCCFGDYYLDGDPKSWSAGSLTSCLGGPGRTSWSDYDQDGLPIGESEYVLEDGQRRTIILQDLIHAHGRHGDASIPIANYLEQLDKPPEEVREIDRQSTPPKTTDLPKFLQTPAGAPNTGYNPGLFFTVECLDQAGEILHQLSLMIREWNTYQEFAEFYESAGAGESADPDAPNKGGATRATIGERGEEGEDCEYENRRIINELSATQYCNDFLDFDDYVEDRINYPQVDYL